MPFLCAVKDGQRGGGKWRKERRRERGREKQWGRERKEETFQSVFSIQRHFDRAEPTLWQGVEPF